MSTLQERLDRIKAGFRAQVSPEVVATFDEAVQGLRDSGIMAGLPAAGSQLPAFSLPDTEGNIVSSDELLANGPAVITFYRGVW